MALDRIDVLVDQKPFTWKLVNSLWIAPTVIGMGIFSLLGWLWAGVLAKSPKIWRIVTVWGIVVALLFLSIALSLENKNSFWDTLGSILFMISWLGSFAHALIIRGTVLREIVSREDELSRLRALYGTHRVPSHSTTARAPVDDRLSRRLSSRDPLPPELEVDMSQYYEQSPPRTAWAPPSSIATRASSAPPSSTPAESRPSSVPAASTPAPPSAIPSEPALVDVNTAPSAALLGLPALDRVTVERIVAAREERGGFHDLNDLTSAAALQPHQLVALQGRVSFSRFRRPGTQVHGRILDL